MHIFVTEYFRFSFIYSVILEVILHYVCLTAFLPGQPR